MINEGLIIMGVGMLVVFAFLTIMVLSMGFMSNLVVKFFPEKEEPVPVRRTKKAPASAVPTGAAVDNTELAIAVALAHSLPGSNTGSEIAAAIAVAHSL